MRINSLSYKNFRNFKNEGKIEFSNDGKITVIYGANGSGKTTLHQLFQWIIYGRTSFNATAGSELYNTTYYDRLSINDKFNVWGSIDFIHNDVNYKMKRIQYYRKKINSAEILETNFTVLVKNENNDWKPIEEPEKFIESLLPEGLAEYFFFDGERMIADLRKKGKDSAKSLKNALYLLLDLSIYDYAIDVIGKRETKYSVIGQLFNSKTKNSGNDSAELNKASIQYESIQEELETLNDKREDNLNNIKEKKERLNFLSEQIGQAKSKKQYENERKILKDLLTSYNENIANNYHSFAKTLCDIGPGIFMAKAIDKVRKGLESDLEKNKVIDGLDKRLIDALLKEEKCLCGNKLTEKEKENLRELYDLLPPNNYEYILKSFIDNSKRWVDEIKLDDLAQIITNSLNNNEKLIKCEDNINKIDKAMKEDGKYEKLIDERLTIENQLDDLDNDKNNCLNVIAKKETILKALQKRIDELNKNNSNNSIIETKIELMENLKRKFEELLLINSKKYSRKLKNNIQYFVDEMLDAKNRKVDVSEDFKITVIDEYGNEAKSEGQFATITFAYISGIFKLLEDENLIANKEFPLILDAPFSKLTNEARNRVIETIPLYAPQIIVLSKDNLQNEIPDEFMGKVYSIKTNESYNVAEIKEGLLNDF